MNEINSCSQKLIVPILWANTVWPDLLNDLPKLGLVTNVQNQVCGPLEIELQDVNEPSRSGDHYLSS